MVVVVVVVEIVMVVVIVIMTVIVMVVVVVMVIVMVMVTVVVILLCWKACSSWLASRSFFCSSSRVQFLRLSSSSCRVLARVWCCSFTTSFIRNWVSPSWPSSTGHTR